ncbi:MAG: GDSL-type esterase/lipase family protein [Campylobacterota bacterium]|nr:GDSL-type esterase/lipase family protein [Campylobacterota bacterium]
MLKLIISALFIFSLWLQAEAPIEHPYYQEKIYEFKQMKQTNLIFLGDSMTDWHNWHLFGPHLNAGIAGDTTDGVLSRIPALLQKKPHTLVLMIGINDLLSGTTLEQVERNYLRILDALFEVKQLIILSTLPVTNIYQTDQINKDVMALNAFLKNEVRKRHLHYVDLHSSFLGEDSGIRKQYTVDGVHLNNQGYILWESILKKEFPSGFY